MSRRSRRQADLPACSECQMAVKHLRDDGHFLAQCSEWLLRRGERGSASWLPRRSVFEVPLRLFEIRGADRLVVCGVLVLRVFLPPRPPSANLPKHARKTKRSPGPVFRNDPRR